MLTCAKIKKVTAKKATNIVNASMLSFYFFIRLFQ